MSGETKILTNGKRLVDATGRRVVKNAAGDCCCGPAPNLCCPTTTNFKITPTFFNYGGCKNQGPASYWSANNWSFANVAYNKANISGIARCLTWGAPASGGGVVNRWRFVDPTPGNFGTAWYTSTDCDFHFIECDVYGLVWNIFCNPATGVYTLTAGNCDHNETATQHDAGGTYHDCDGIGWGVPAQAYTPRDGAFMFWGTFTLPSCTSTVTVSESDPSGGSTNSPFIYGSGFWHGGTPTVSVQAGGC